MFRKEITSTAQDYYEIVKFTEFHRKKAPIIIMLSAAALFVVFLCLCLCGWMPWIAGGIACFLCVCVILFFPIKLHVTSKNGIKYGKIALNTKRTLEFDGNSLRLYGGRTKTDINAPWHTIFAIYETDKCFFIYITFETVLCVQKNQLTLTEVLDVRNYFIKKMGDRFYIRFKR